MRESEGCSISSRDGVPSRSLPSPDEYFGGADALALSARESASIFGLFLAPVSSPLPQHCQLKSAGALSRFLKHYGWPTRKVIRRVRSWALEQLLGWVPQGRRPHLQLIVDLTSLEKIGKFQQLPGLVRWYNRKRGLHLVVLYLVVGRWRLPFRAPLQGAHWGFRIYRGKGSATPVQLALRLLSTLPPGLRQRYEGMVLADAGFRSATIPRQLSCPLMWN